MPITLAATIPRIGFFGIIFLTNSSDTNTCRIADIKTPIKTKGIASKIILIKTDLNNCN